MELQDIRKQLDEIDDQLTVLFLRRMEWAARAAARKKAQGLPVLDAEREQQIIARVTRQAGKDMGEYIQPIFRALFSVSRAYQETLLSAEADQDGTRP